MTSDDQWAVNREESGAGGHAHGEAGHDHAGHEGHDHSAHAHHEMERRSHEGHGHADQPHDYRGASKRSLLIVLVLIAGHMGVEIAGGILSGSLGLLAHATHMLTDAVAIGLALFAMWIAERPATITRTLKRRPGSPALGRRLGGFSTKVHVSVDSLGNPLRFILTGGQQHDITQAEGLITGYVC